MSAYQSIRGIENSAQHIDGAVWYRLHSEREDVCEALVKEFRPRGEPQPGLGLSKDETWRAESWHQEMLQARLGKIDDALDRLMAGSYGNCCQCGRWIEDTKLNFDPAVAFCINCWEKLQTIH